MMVKLNRILPILLLLFVFTNCGNEKTAPTNTNTTPSTNNSIKQFVKVPAQQAGIDFKNSLIETFEVNYYKFQYLYNGGGVAIGDINNDGLPDLYFTATIFSNKLYLNKGNFQFEDITEQAGVGLGTGTRTGVTMVDINNDGFLDIYVCRTGQMTEKDLRSNQFFINNGDLTFTEKSKSMGLEDFCFSNYANFFDYDNDGDLDMYLLNHPTDFKKESRIQIKTVNGKKTRTTVPDNEYESDRLYENNGNGTFTNVSAKAGISNRGFGLSASVTDVNKDGWMDIFVANDYDEPDFFYINQKNGTFIDESIDLLRHMSQNSMGSDFGDINNDGWQDLMVLDMLPEDNRRQKALQTSMQYERVSANKRAGRGYQYMRNVLQLNNGMTANGNTSFSEIGELAGITATDWSWGALIADYDNDGHKDVFIANGIRRDVTDADYVKFKKSQFSEMKNAETIYDFLNQIPSQKVRNYMYRNNGDLTFKDASYNFGISEQTFSNGSAWGDLDGDGDLDLVINNIDDEVSIYNNQANQIPNSHYLQISLEGSSKNKKGIGASVTIKTANGLQYQEMTPSHGFFSSMDYILNFGLKDQKIVNELTIRWADGKTQTLQNINADQKFVLKYSDAIGNSPANTSKNSSPIFTKQNLNLPFSHKENGFVDFNREPLIPRMLSKDGPALAVADVNGDGMEDFFVGGGSGQSGVLFLQNANTFSKSSSTPWNADKNQEDVNALFFDADGDKDMDLYVVSGGSAETQKMAVYQDRLYINDGKGNFTKSVDAIPQMPVSSSNVAAGDLDGDGDLDLFVGGRLVAGRYPTTPRSYILKNDGGKFSDITKDVNSELLSIGMVTDAQWVDLDNDKDMDLVVVGEWMAISIFINNNGKLENQTNQMDLKKSNGWWYSVAAVDMDGDGDMDLIGGNMGLNTRLQATTSQPLQLYAKDFDNNGAIDPVMTRYVQNGSFPVPQRDVLVKQMPFLAKKFNEYGPYAIATINEVFTRTELQDAQILTAYTTANTYFENNDGKFIAKPLPNLAQIAPGKAILTSDFDKDGLLDILIVGNDYGMEVETGRFDAGNGTLLKGDGKGNFTPLSIQKSGFYNPKDARSMKSVKLANGKTLVLVANNEDKINSFVVE